MREAARKRMDKAQRRRMHRELGEALLDSAGEQVRGRLEAGLHLVSGGDESRGADIWACAARTALQDSGAADDTALAVRALGARAGGLRKAESR
jgi:hypothetical protein